MTRYGFASTATSQDRTWFLRAIAAGRTLLRMTPTQHLLPRTISPASYQVDPPLRREAAQFLIRFIVRVEAYECRKKGTLQQSRDELRQRVRLANTNRSGIQSAGSR
jgi:hypothetical protein